MKYMKRTALLGLTGALGVSSVFIYPAFVKADTSTVISLGDTITVDGSTIGTASTDAVYLSSAVESHSDITSELSNITNQVIHITKNGTYTISGTLTNAQIVVDAASAPSASLIFDSVTLTNQTASAVLIQDSSYTPASTASSTISIQLNGESTIKGSHIPKNTASYNNIKYDGVISSDVSLTINGSGSLNITGDKEGIETKEHLIINDGNLAIVSYDDGINACTDDISCITINGGSTYVNIANDASEGDGIDSNGYITINDGIVYAYAHPSSPDGGLDSDDGITINGGTVIATGCNMESVSSSSSQTVLQNSFSSLQSADTLFAITSSDGSPVMAFQTQKTFQAFLYSAPNLTSASYKLYTGGTISGSSTHGLYTDITSYSDGTEVSWSSNSGDPGSGDPGNKPGNDPGNNPGSDPGSGSTPSKPEEGTGNYSSGIITDSNGVIRCYNPDGSSVVNDFKCDGIYTYYFQADGTAMKNTLTYDPQGTGLIYFDSDGHMAFDAFWYCENVGYTCYFNSNGRAVFDEIVFCNNNAYYLNACGKMETEGFFSFANGVDYGYANADGTLLTNQFSFDSLGRMIYLHWNGMIARGLITDGTWYYLMDETDGHYLGQFEL